MTWIFELHLLSRGKNFFKNKAILLMWLESLNCPYYHELKFSQNYGRFYEATWKFALPLLSRGKIFTKIKQFGWCNLKFWTVPIITSSNVCKNTPDLIKLLEYLNCAYYHELKFCQKCGRFYEVTWNFALPLLSRGKLFPKIKQFCWRDLKIWHTLIITSWNFCKK